MSRMNGKKTHTHTHTLLPVVLTPILQYPKPNVTKLSYISSGSWCLLSLLFLCPCMAVGFSPESYFNHMHVCMYDHHVQQEKDQRLPILLVVSQTKKINISLSPFAPENLVWRDGFGSSVPRRPAHLHTQAESGAYLRNSSRFPRRRPFIYLNRRTSSGRSRVYRVTQLRTDGVHCRESAGTGPANLKVVPNGCHLPSRSPWTN